MRASGKTRSRWKPGGRSVWEKPRIATVDSAGVERQSMDLSSEQVAAIIAGGRVADLIFPSSPESYVAAGVVVRGVWPGDPPTISFGAGGVGKTAIDQIAVTHIKRVENEV